MLRKSFESDRHIVRSHDAVHFLTLTTLGHLVASSLHLPVELHLACLPCDTVSTDGWSSESEKMKQLDVVVSPPAFLWDPFLTLTHMTFDLDICDLWPLGHRFYALCKVLKNMFFLHGDLDLWPTTFILIDHLDIINVHHPTKFGDPNLNGSWDMNYCPVNFGPVSFGPVTDRQKAVHKSQPCISTGVLKNIFLFVTLCRYAYLGISPLCCLSISSSVPPGLDMRRCNMAGIPAEPPGGTRPAFTGASDWDLSNRKIHFILYCGF